MLRSATLEETWRRFSPRAKRAGITRIAELTGLDTLGIPVFAAIRPMGTSLSTQQGKGVTAEAARVSALMEALETWSAENITLPRVRGSYRELAKKRHVVDVRKLPRAVKKLDLDARWEWIEGRVGGMKPILVPLQAVTLDTTFEDPPVFDISSNGLGAGNNLHEAIWQGLLEVIERHAEAAWRRSGSDRRIVLDTITDPVCQDLIARITNAGPRIFLWHLDAPFDACVIGCGIMEHPDEPAWRALGMYQGFGASIDPAHAIQRAIVEAAQTRLTYIAGARDDFFPFDYERATDPEILGEVWDRLAAPCEEPVVFDDLPRAEHGALTLEAACLWVNLTHPELKVPCVKVIIPGYATDVEALG
jgi:ribosomal protein S12 methylthiotransferase accessory factor